MNNGQPSHVHNEFPPSPFREGPRLFNRDPFMDRGDAQHGFPNGGVPFSPNSQSFPQSQIPYAPQLDTRSLHSFALSDRQPVSTPLTPHRNIQQPFISSPVASSPWPSQDPATVRRPGPFDPEYPTSRNTVAQRTVTPSQSIPQPAVNPAPSATNDQSPWFTSSQGAVTDGWTSDSLTAANLGQHNRQQEEAARQQDTQPAPAESPAVEEAAPETTPQPQGSPEAPAAPVAEPETPSQRRRRKASVPASATPAAQSAPAKTATSAPAPAPAPTQPANKSPSPTPQPTEVKPAWGTVDEDKKKPSGAPLGLREIQEMETKKLEARKAAERERERAARAAAAAAVPSSEDVQTTLSWGLPTSQVGARAASAAKETAQPQAASSPVTPATPVWTTAAKAPVVKKTMKEIQEEEERRKKMAAKEKETVAAAARRAYADTTTKVGVSDMLSRSLPSSFSRPQLLCRQVVLGLPLGREARPIQRLRLLRRAQQCLQLPPRRVSLERLRRL